MHFFDFKLKQILYELLNYFEGNYRRSFETAKDYGELPKPKLPSSFGFFPRTELELKLYKETPKPVFELKDLMPRDYKVFQRDGVSIERVLDVVRFNLLRYTYWERLLKEIFYHAERDVVCGDSEKVRRGKFKVYARISQMSLNRFNWGFVSGDFVGRMLDDFFKFGILSNVPEKEWDNYHFDHYHPDLSYARGYEVNLKRLFAWMRAVRTLIFDNVWARFHVNLLQVENMEDNYLRKFGAKGCAARLKKLDEFYCKNFGEQWIVLATTRKDTDKDLDYRHIRRALKMKLNELELFESFCYEHADVILNAAQQSKIEFSKGLRAYLEILAHIIKLLKVFNADKGRGNRKISPHLLKVKRKIRITQKGRHLGSITFRIANDLCSVPKKDPIYKGVMYLNRDEIFKEMFGRSKVYQYDTANSVHADNVYMRTGKRLKGDLYTDIIPPLFKERLVGDEGWVESVGGSWINKKTWKGKETAGQVFDALLERSDTKGKCNILYAVRGSGGKLYNFLFQRFTENAAADENYKNGVKIYCKHFGDVYREIVGKTLGSHIYAVESFRMLWVACEILKRGQRAGLVYDCLVTDGELKAGEFDELNNAALDELKIIGKDFYDLWEGLK